MNALWQQLTLSTLPLQSWLGASYLHRLIGLLRAWRSASRLMRWATPIGGGLAMVVFALVPFVSNELVGILLAACGVYWLLLTLSDDDQEFFATPIHLMVLLYWGIATIATLFSPTVNRAAASLSSPSGLIARLLAITLKNPAFIGWQKLTLYLLLFALLARVLRSPRIRSWLVTVYLLTALAVSVYGLQQWISGAAALATWVDPTSPLSKTTRVYSYLGNPNLLAGYLLPAVVFSITSFFSWRSWMQKGLAVLMAAVNGACLMLTFSRGGWIGLVFSLFVLLLLLAHWWSIYLPRFWRTWALPIVLGTASVVVILAVVVVEPLRDRVGSIFAGRGDSSNNFRINVWMAVIEMIKDYPVLGIGPGNSAFNKIYPLYMKARYSALSAYSILLEVALETGLIGLTCFLWLLLVVLNQGWRALQQLRHGGDRTGYLLIGAIASLFGMFGHGLVDTVLYRPEVNTLWWLMLAMIASYYGREGTGDSSSV
jgi:putative inorganic carbon (HCO3(-)) transporter